MMLHSSPRSSTRKQKREQCLAIHAPICYTEKQLCISLSYNKPWSSVTLHTFTSNEWIVVMRNTCLEQFRRNVVKNVKQKKAKHEPLKTTNLFLITCNLVLAWKYSIITLLQFHIYLDLNALLGHLFYLSRYAK